ncbi:DUF5655 domain-containing protein [Holzapfeliella sp. He02]|uniref:DUF5655 domain-containing protein n=1 Tax=Holzapfeliella saturejae TaxID=3082953 RepID=A0ABU8SER5_9LACO
MSLYQFKNNQLTRLKAIPFKVEKEIQRLVEENTEVLLGLTFLATEFHVEHYRLDTVAFDETTNSFVIIEYKNDTKYSVIDQRYAYLNTLLNHKADFVLLYNEVHNTHRRVDEFNFEQTKINFITKGYTNYQLDAVNNPELPIDLYQIKQFENGQIQLDYIEKTKPAKVAKSQTTLTKEQVNFTQISELKNYTEADMLKKGSDETNDLYQELKIEILDLNPNISIKAHKTYLAFLINDKDFCDITIQKKQLKLFLNMKFGQLNDKLDYARDMRNIGKYGNGDYEVTFNNHTDLPYIIDLIKQSMIKNDQ